MTPLRLGVLAWSVGHPPDLAGFTARLDAALAAAAGRADLVLLPEYACLELGAALATSPDAAAGLRAMVAAAPALLDAMRAAARHHGVWLQPGTLPVQVAAGIVNRAPLIAPDGRCAWQDKYAMTRPEAEAWGVVPGSEPQVFPTPWGLIGISIGYDAEFPKHIRAQVEAGAWLVLVPACTGTRHAANRLRLAARARALENQACVAVAPTLGAAPWSIMLATCHGRAAVYGPVDNGFPEDGVIAEAAPDAPGWVFATLNPARIEAVRREGAARHHRDWPRGPVGAPRIATFTTDGPAA